MTSFAYRVGMSRFVLVLCAAVAAVACGDNLKPSNPDAAVDANQQALCGNNVLDPNEDCDDGDQQTDTTCDNTCHFTCGNGMVEAAFGELCDPGIAAGAGACPATCDDGMACTFDVQSGTGCQAECMNAPITVPANGDGCCPAGANALTDDDCDPVCGNTVIETGETCDTGIAAPGPGSCPSACNDGMSCTADMLTGAGTCTAACSATPITMAMNGDGCCPTGATPMTDNDCVLGCGNGVVGPGETCDTAIVAGPGRCPTACDDGMVCTRNQLVNGGTCTAACTFPVITMPMSGDGCCPAGANANTDTDCTPVCGNMVVEGTEQCDDGNMINTDTCSNLCRTNVVTTAFKFTDLHLQDPHAWVSFLGCRDVTPHGAIGFSVNDELHTNINTDGDNDGLLDLAPTLVFRNFNQTAPTQPVELHFADCTAPEGSTMCSPSGAQVVMATATFMNAGTCLQPLPNTVRPYAPAVTNTGGPCFVTNAVTVTLDLGGIPVTLRDARIAATYVGNPATTMTNGLLMGFITEADANATIIPATFPVVGGRPLSSLLPGGMGNCSTPSDKDINNGVMGWWFYLNFPTRRVPFSG